MSKGTIGRISQLNQERFVEPVSPDMVVSQARTPRPGREGGVRPSWSSLPRRAKAFRMAHIAWGVVAMQALAYVWASAIVRRRDRRLWASVTFLLVQGMALLIGRGDCPFGPFQRRLGDPVPMFELILPPRVAKAAIPVLLWLSVAGMLAVIVRPPQAGGPVARQR